MEPAVARDEARLQLFDEHLADLRRSGLTDETIALMGVRSLTAAELAAALGYVPTGVQSALALPYPGLDWKLGEVVRKRGKEDSLLDVGVESVQLPQGL